MMESLTNTAIIHNTTNSTIQCYSETLNTIHITQNIINITSMDDAMHQDVIN